jgi:hypothetical protein
MRRRRFERRALLRRRHRPDREVVEFFLERAAAEAMIRETREDEPVLTEDLRVEAIELAYLQQHVPP